MAGRSKSTLFLIEQLIVIAVFAICAVACIRIISTAYLYSRDSRDIGFAVIAAENAAETFKATSGDFYFVADLIGGAVVNGDSEVIVYFDSDWEASIGENAAHILKLTETDSEFFGGHTLISANVSVFRYFGDNIGDELISFDVATIRVHR